MVNANDITKQENFHQSGVGWVIRFLWCAWCPRVGTAICFGINAWQRGKYCMGKERGHYGNWHEVFFRASRQHITGISREMEKPAISMGMGYRCQREILKTICHTKRQKRVLSCGKRLHQKRTAKRKLRYNARARLGATLRRERVKNNREMA